jgi:hypothetical protein
MLRREPPPEACPESAGPSRPLATRDRTRGPEQVAAASWRCAVRPVQFLRYSLRPVSGRLTGLRGASELRSYTRASRARGPGGRPGAFIALPPFPLRIPAGNSGLVFYLLRGIRGSCSVRGRSRVADRPPFFGPRGGPAPVPIRGSDCGAAGSGSHRCGGRAAFPMRSASGAWRFCPALGTSSAIAAPRPETDARRSDEGARVTVFE